MRLFGKTSEKTVNKNCVWLKEPGRIICMAEDGMVRNRQVHLLKAVMEQKEWLSLRQLGRLLAAASGLFLLYRCLWVHKYLPVITAFLRQTIALKILSCKQFWCKNWWVTSLASQGGGCHGQLWMAWLCSDLHLQNGASQIQPNTRSHLWV